MFSFTKHLKFLITFEEKLSRQYFKDLIPPTTMADFFPVYPCRFSIDYQLVEYDKWSAVLKFKIDKLFKVSHWFYGV
ncbi:hypothetical protein DAPPUDRAFT_251656 [Daphnia pulex]|uniref:Uncharacterized protein n=1 Tax=Daphnia pulex TaxID=6669 RepID=E9H0V3_DAPPU|nr:hypothetical protein DAPPUDRAFT_251656 [Daphnia pulex]|eukprot:EFX74523.1 hypothetical protein DAPPUDRAFT_251656 [Daphnia pulex]